VKHHARKALNRRRSPDLYWRRYRPPFTPMRGCDVRLSAADHARFKERLTTFSRILAAPYGETPPYHAAPPYVTDPYQELGRLARPKASPTIRYLTA
jgi:hypothetical protein